MNIGTNRWAAKTELGLTHPMGKWLLEAYVGAWWFEDNDDFFGGQLREQDPLASIQAHVSYTFRPRMWLALRTPLTTRAGKLPSTEWTNTTGNRIRAPASHSRCRSARTTR